MGFFDEDDGAMFGVDWQTSARRFPVRVAHNVKIPMADGVRLDASIWYPDSPGRFPALLGFHCYHPAGQTGPIRPTAISSAQWRHAGQERTNGSLEAGDPNFFARRGYVHVVCNARGTGKSEGLWHAFGPQEVRDACEVVEWMAAQPWCDGNVGMFGVSYFARIQLLAAMANPPHLKALFCPWTGTDYYRDSIYRGGSSPTGGPWGGCRHPWPMPTAARTTTPGPSWARSATGRPWPHCWRTRTSRPSPSWSAS